MRLFPFKSLLVSALVCAALAGCSPQYNWRNYASKEAPFHALFPDKPAVHTRSVDLDGLKVDMTMTAVDIDGVTFAVGSAEAPDAARAQAAVAAMKTALVRNIGATVTSEKVGTNAIDIDAAGVRKGTPMRLVGHFEARGKRFYQVIVMGPAKSLTKDNVDMFITSFKLQ